MAWNKMPRNQGGLGGIQIPLVSDFNKDISRAYEVLVEDPTDELHGASLRGLFVIDGKGTLRMTQVNDAPVGRNADEILRIVEAF
jgi:peroxiredoxin (alkyl hydroperoxide reductase subunit C)